MHTVLKKLGLSFSLLCVDAHIEKLCFSYKKIASLFPVQKDNIFEIYSCVLFYSILT